MRRQNPLYGNENGLPGLPKTTYVTVGGRKVQPRPPRTQHRVPPAPPRSTRPNPIIRQPPPAPLVLPSGPDPMLARRIDTLELRISSTEQSNRTLLDELMRLQQDIKANVRKNELGIQEERDSRSRLEMTLRQSQTKNHEVEDRIRRCEDGIKENRGAVQQLSTHLQSVERMVTSLQQDVLQRSSESGNKGKESQHEFRRLVQENEQLNKITKNLREQGRDNSTRIDNFQAEIIALQNGLRLQAQLVEDASNMPAPQSSSVDKRIVDQDRANNEQKIMKMNKTVQDISSKLSAETLKREKTEQDINQQITQLKNDVNATKTKGEKNQEEYDKKMKSLHAGFSDTDKQQIRMEMSRISNELNTKIETNDSKIREDTVEKLNVIEDTLLKENERRSAKEKELEQILDTKMKKIKENESAQSENIQKALQEGITAHKEKLSKLNKRMNDVEESVRTHTLEHSKLLEAEITERLSGQKILDGKIDDLEDDCQLGFKTLQDEIGQLSRSKRGSKTSKEPPPPSVNVDEILERQEQKTNGIRAQIQSDIGTLEKRVSTLETDLKQRDDALDNRIQTSKAEEKEATSLLGDQMQQQMDALLFKHNKLRKKVDDLEADVSTTPKSLQTFKEETNGALDQVTSDLRKEEKERKRNVEELRDSVQKIVGGSSEANVPSLAQLNLDMDQTQTGLKKCAESIHMVKTLLTDKVKDERKIREKQNAILETDVERLDTKIKELKERVKNSGNNDTITSYDDFL